MRPLTRAGPHPPGLRIIVPITPDELKLWQNFYVIVGSSAGALTGLQFVVITLLVQARTASSMREIHAFGTPTVTHFCMALLISAVMNVPWHAPVSLAGTLAASGAVGLIYLLRVISHARKADYEPDLEDWIWYIVLPLAAHLSLITAAVLIWFNLDSSLAVIAADAVAFLLIGVHNSWDTVTFLAVRNGTASRTAKDNGTVERPAK